jgi:6-phosphogluconate dehydrogenase
MQLAMIGLGRMGANMVRRLVRDGHECVVYDVDPAVSSALAEEAEGITAVASLDELSSAMTAPRSVWMMVPAGLVDQVIDDVAPHLEEGDTLIDGGNSNHKDDLRRSADLAERGLHYVDVGVSGGVWGLENGYALMIGGDDEAVGRLEPVFRSLAPGVDAVLARTVGREGDPVPAEEGWLHCGPAGAGHFVKMVHNGIEYGLMAAYAEGLNILASAGIGLSEAEHNAETAPMRSPEQFQYEFDLADIVEVWRRGTVIRSWLVDLTANALFEDPALAAYEGRVSDSGEGRWTCEAAIETGVPAPVLTSALFARFSSRGRDDFAGKVLSAQRKQFGGHSEIPGVS